MTDGTAQPPKPLAETAQEVASDAGDRKADGWAVMVIFVAAILMVVTYVSGFSFDFN